MVLRDGIILYAQPGALPEPALEQLIAKARELDMDEVRASIAERSRSAPSGGSSALPARRAAISQAEDGLSESREGHSQDLRAT